MLVGLGEGEDEESDGSFEMTNVMSAAGGKVLALGGGLEAAIASPVHTELRGGAGKDSAKSGAKKCETEEMSAKATSNLKVNPQRGKEEEEEEEDIKLPSRPPSAPHEPDIK